MTHPTVERQIVDLLEEYLEGGRTLEQFLPDFALLSWNVHRVGEPVAERLANEIELRLAEYSSGDWTRGQLNSMLADLRHSHPDTAVTDWRLTMSDRRAVSGSWTESARVDRQHATVAW